MKTVALSSLALAAGVAAMPYPEDIAPPAGSFNFNSAMEVVNALAEGKMADIMGGEHATEQFTSMARMLGAGPGKAGELSSITKDVLNMGYGKIPPGPKDAPNKVVMTPTYPVPGSKKVKMRYGPYLVPNMNKKNMAGEMGSLFNFPDEFERPCSGNCTIFGVQASLEYPDGKSANIDTGMWLHHMVLFTSGSTRSDPTCRDRDVSVPHVVAGETPQHSERFIGAGNERTRFTFAPEAKVGYRLRADDKFKIIMDLMNENDVDKAVYFTMTWEYTDGYVAGFDDLQPVWLDIRQCGTSEVISPHTKNTFSVGSDWSPDFSGEIIGAGGHLHDGGTSLKLTLDGEVLCDSKASYGGSKEFVAPTDGHTGSHGKIEHISGMTGCAGNVDFHNVTLKAGQKWRIEGFYDYDQHRPSGHRDGDSLDTVMGLALMFVRGRNPSGV